MCVCPKIRKGGHKHIAHLFKKDHSSTTLGGVMCAGKEEGSGGNSSRDTKGPKEWSGGRGERSVRVIPTKPS